MKVNKIGNKAVIVLTRDELAKRKITVKDIKEGHKNVQDFFFDILEEENMLEDFTEDSSQLFVEVSVLEDDLFTITITKVDHMPNIEEYTRLVKRIHYTVSSNIFAFSTLETLLDFCIKAKHEKLYVGSNSLYEIENKYYLLFSNSTIKKADFVKTFSILSEYADNYYAKKLHSFYEYANLLLPKNAIQTLQAI